MDREAHVIINTCAVEIYWNVIVADSDLSMPVWLFPATGLMATSVSILNGSRFLCRIHLCSVDKTSSGWIDGKEEWPGLRPIVFRV